jgi:hypothetical protein
MTLPSTGMTLLQQGQHCQLQGWICHLQGRPCQKKGRPCHLQGYSASCRHCSASCQLHWRMTLPATWTILPTTEIAPKCFELLYFYCCKVVKKKTNFYALLVLGR